MSIKYRLLVALVVAFYLYYKRASAVPLEEAFFLESETRLSESQDIGTFNHDQPHLANVSSTTTFLGGPLGVINFHNHTIHISELISPSQIGHVMLISHYQLLLEIISTITSTLEGGSGLNEIKDS